MELVYLGKEFKRMVEMSGNAPWVPWGKGWLGSWATTPGWLRNYISPQQDNAMSKACGHSIFKGKLQNLANFKANCLPMPADYATQPVVVDVSVGKISAASDLKAAERCRKELEELTPAIQQLREQLTQKVNLYQRVSARLLELDAKAAELSNNSQALITAMGKVQGVMTAGFADGCLVVDTQPLMATALKTGTRYAIGAYRIRINTANASITIMANDTLSRRYVELTGGHQGPHINSNGSPCFGTLEGVLPDLIGQGAWVEVVSLCIQFLQSVDEQDAWAQHVWCFPQVAPAQRVDSRWSADVKQTLIDVAAALTAAKLEEK